MEAEEWKEPQIRVLAYYLCEILLRHIDASAGLGVSWVFKIQDFSAFFL